MTSAVYTNFAKLERVDAEKGVIYGVSVITVGEAEGHGLWVDEVAINQILQLARAKSEGVKVQADHGKGVFAATGKLVNFRRDGDKIRADLELLKSDDNFEKVIEMATKLPNEFGLSVSTDAKSENTNGKKMVRFLALESVDLVSHPAANTGLFSSKTNNQNSMIDKIELCKLLQLDENVSDEALKTAFSKYCKDMSAEGESEAKKKLKAKKDKEEAEAESEAKKEKFEALLEPLKLQLEALTGANKAALELAKKNEVASLIAAASAEGKVVPLTDVQLCKMELSDVKEMFSKLPKGQLRLSKTGTSNAPAVPKTESEKVEFCRTQREAGAAQLTAQFAAAGLVQLN